ncbi:MAG: hypothetical protein HON90_00850 [Halobacteriovoraceae bacterium]|jgi:hypothetical protein|nr:hypothetical protein [Halobacteriovoraceae bacterium]
MSTRSIRYGLLSFLAITFFSCIVPNDITVDKKNDVDPSSPPPTVDQIKLEHSFIGTWIGNCTAIAQDTKATNSPAAVAFYMKFENFTGRFPQDSEAEIGLYSADDNLCTGTRAYTLLANFNLHKRAGSTDVWVGTGEKLNFVLNSLELAPNTALFTNNFNNSLECGFDNWQTDTYKDITGLTCGQTNNAIFEMPRLNQVVYYLASLATVDVDGVNEYRAHLAWCPIGLCNTEETRPADVDPYSLFYLTKQN